MRAKEFIKEDVVQNDLSHPSLRPVMHFPDMDRYYELYRMSIDMAELGSPEGIEGDDKGWPVKDHAVMIAYSDADEKIIKQAVKKRGFKYRKANRTHGQEVNDVYATSPVAKPKKNRFGI